MLDQITKSFNKTETINRVLQPYKTPLLPENQIKFKKFFIFDITLD